MTEEAQVRMAEAFAARHPEDVARILERAAISDVAGLLAKWRPEISGSVASRMVPQVAAAGVAALPTEDAVRVLEAMRSSAAASVLGKVNEGARNLLVDAMRGDASAPVRRLLAQPPGTAGSVMEPIVPAVAVDVMASEAVELLRASFPEARSFVYAVSRDGILEGVSTVAELAFAGAAPVRTVMKTGIESIPSRASLEALAGHPGWRKVHQLPVVAPDGRLLGVVHHEVVRRIEAELGTSTARPPAASTAAALGSFYALGVGGFVAWVGQAVLTPGRRDAP